MAKLDRVHPNLVDAIDRIQLAMRDLGFEMLVTNGVRSQAEQQALYAQGRSTPGAIVTHADGVVTRSNHQIHEDGYGHAVDLAFLVDGQPSWADTLPWRLYAEMAKALGLRAGADWTTPDRPHVELP